MPKIIFKIDKKQDAKNWQRVTHMDNPPYGLTRVKNKQKKLKDFSTTELDALKKNKQQLEEYFEKKGSIIFSSIEQVTHKPMYTNIFHASFTTAGLMPYDMGDSWFMIPAQKSIKKQASVAIHELLHLQICYYYLQYCLRKGLSRRQFSELSEIIVAILNKAISKKLNLPRGKEYPKHKSVAERLKRLWIKDKNFKNLLDKSVILIKSFNN